MNCRVISIKQVYQLRLYILILFENYFYLTLRVGKIGNLLVQVPITVGS